MNYLEFWMYVRMTAQNEGLQTMDYVMQHKMHLYKFKFFPK